MRALITVVAAVGFLLAAGCSSTRRDEPPAARTETAIESLVTDLGREACREEIDRTDPNETPYRVCPGVAGYALIVRRVDSGRESIEVVDPAGRVSPLDCQEFVTRHMCTLGSEAEWRVATRGDGKREPLALIVPVEARENADDPAEVTTTYLAVARLAPGETCVTDRLVVGRHSQVEVRRAADAASARPCVPPRPPMTVDASPVR